MSGFLFSSEDGNHPGEGGNHRVRLVSCSAGVLMLAFSLILFSGFAVQYEENLVQADQVQIDSLRQIIELSDVDETTRIGALISLSWRIKSSDPDEALTLAKQALDISRELGFVGLAARALNNMGVIYWQKGDFPQALDHLFEAFHIYREENDSLGIARIHTNIGLIFSDQGHYDRALEYYLVSRTIYEQLGTIAGLAPVLNNIGTVYQYQGDFSQAEAYHLQSLALKDALGDQKGIAFSLNNLGLVRQYMGDYSQALEYFNRALAIRETLPELRETAITIGNIGYLNLLLGEVRPAMEYFLRARDIYYEINDQSGLAKTYNHMGRAMFARGRPNDAILYFQTSLDYAEKVGLPRLISDNFRDLSQSMAGIQDYRAAFDYQERYLAMRDSIYDEEAQRRIIEMELMYDRERKEDEIELLRINNEISQLNLEKQRILQNFLLVVIALVVGLLILLMNRYRFITKTNRKLQELNSHLREQTAKVEELNQQLNVTNSAKDKFFSIISHDLRNPFASIVSFSRILKRDIDNLGREELQDLVAELDKSVLKISNLLENLLQWSRSQGGKIKPLPAQISISGIVKENLNLFAPMAREKGIELLNELPGDVYAWADPNMVDTVIRNLVSNALKYTDSNGIVRVGSEPLDQQVSLFVEDTGIGIAKEDQENLFHPDAFHSTYGTRDEKGSGLGLMLCKEFVVKMGGHIYFDSQQGSGSRFVFTLPLRSPDI
jgi:signal transduction histidine kinase